MGARFSNFFRELVGLVALVSMSHRCLSAMAAVREPMLAISLVLGEVGGAVLDGVVMLHCRQVECCRSSHSVVERFVHGCKVASCTTRGSLMHS